MNYKIIGDSCCDYTEHKDGLPWLTRVPLTIELDKKSYVDDETFDCLDFLKNMAASPNAPKSSCPAPGQYMDAFIGDEENIYVVTLSEKLSGSYNSALSAADLFKEENPNKKIHVFNSRSASAGQIAICLKIHELAEQGLEFEAVVKQTEAFISNLKTFFVLENLDTLRKNGRLTHLEAFITSALKIKVVMGGEPDGTIGVRGKALTIDSAISKLIDKVKECCEQIKSFEKTLVISQCNNIKRAELVKNRILSACNFKDVVICRTGGISTLYANSGGIVLSF